MYSELFFPRGNEYFLTGFLLGIFMKISYIELLTMAFVKEGSFIVVYIQIIAILAFFFLKFLIEETSFLKKIILLFFFTMGLIYEYITTSYNIVNLYMMAYLATFLFVVFFLIRVVEDKICNKKTDILVSGINP